MRSCSAALRGAADHAVTMGTRRAQQLQRILHVLLLPACATRWPILDRTPPSVNLARPPQPAQTITGPGPNASEQLEEDADQCGVAKASRRPASFVDALRLVVPASPSKFGTAFTFSPKMRLSLKLRPRAEGVDDHGRSGPSNEAASSIVSTGLMTRKTHTVGRVTLISPLPFLFPCASGSNVGCGK